MLPVNHAERIFAVVLVVMGAIMFTFLISSISDLALTGNHSENAAMFSIQRMSDLCRYKCLPDPLRARAKKQISHVMSKAPHLSHQDLGLLSRTMLREMMEYLAQDYLQRIPLFVDLGSDCRARLAECLRPCFFGPQQKIFVASEIATEMYWVVSGEVEMKDWSGRSVARAEAGDLVGHIEMFLPENMSYRLFSLSSRTRCELLELRGSDLEGLVRPLIPDLYEAIRAYAMAQLESVDLAEAQKRYASSVSGRCRDLVHRAGQHRAVLSTVQRIKSLKTPLRNGSSTLFRSSTSRLLQAISSATAVRSSGAVVTPDNVQAAEAAHEVANGLASATGVVDASGTYQAAVAVETVGGVPSPTSHRRIPFAASPRVHPLNSPLSSVRSHSGYSADLPKSLSPPAAGGGNGSASHEAPSHQTEHPSESNQEWDLDNSFASHIDLTSQIRPSSIQKNRSSSAQSTAGASASSQEGREAHSLPRSKGEEKEPGTVGAAKHSSSWASSSANEHPDAPAAAAAAAAAEVMGVLRQVLASQERLAGDVESVRGDVMALRGDVSTVRGGVADTAASAAAAAAAAAAAEMMAALRQVVASQERLAGDVVSVRGDVMAVRGDVSAVRGDVADLRSELAALRSLVYQSTSSSPVGGVRSGGAADLDGLRILPLPATVASSPIRRGGHSSGGAGGDRHNRSHSRMVSRPGLNPRAPMSPLT